MTSRAGILAKLQAAWNYVHCRWQVLLPCRFSALVLVFLGFAFSANQQGAETLRVLAEYTPGEATDIPIYGPSYRVRVAVFLVTVLAFSLQTWYCSRQVLFFAFPGSPNPEQVKKTVEWTPRILGALGFLAPALGLLLAARPFSGEATGLIMRLLALALALCAALFLLLVSRRRKVFGLESGEGVFVSRIGSVRELHPTTRWVLLATVGAGIALFFGIIFWPVTVSQWLGSPAILMLCATIWVTAGAVCLYLTAWWRLPFLSAVVLWACLVSPFTDNHAVRTLPSAAPARVSLEEALAERQGALDRAFGKGEHPVFIVATEGGGIRAAYWTTAVLTAIQDRYPSFASHCFAISGVSGGSLGAAVFATLVDERLKSPAQPTATYREDGQKVLTSDFLAPVLARLFGTDLPKQFLPWVPLPDRANGHERAWERGWRALGSRAFEGSFCRLFDQPTRPLLFLNGTWAETGRRIIFSRVRIGDEFESAVDGLDQLGGRDLPISSAVDMSARFLYVSPAGTIHPPKGPSLHVVDGGYFENSGAATASNIVRFLASRSGSQLKPRVIVIRYAEGLDERFRPFLSEVLSPVHAMLAARTARGNFAVEELKKRNPETVEFVLRSEPGTPLPLGWLLSDRARDAIDATIREPEARAALTRLGVFFEAAGLPAQPAEDKVADRANQSKAIVARSSPAATVRQAATSR